MRLRRGSSGWPAAGVPALALAALALAACGSGCGSRTTAPAADRHRAHGTTLTPGGARSAQGPATAARATPALIPPANAPARSVTVPVLTYHRVAPLSAAGLPELKVDPANFASELSALHASGYHPIHQSQLFGALYYGAKLPSKPIVISVDDGYVDDIRTILPDLQRWRMTAIFFVITGRMTEPGFLSADQIRQLDRAGMDVGDHTAHHVDLRAITPSELRMETAGSRRTLEAVLGHPVYYFAYPFGAYNDAVVRAVKAAGFTMAYTTAAGSTERTASPLTWPRIHVGRSETPSGIVSLLGGR